MCSGPDRVTAEYGIEATRIIWYQKHDQRKSGFPDLALKIFGKVLTRSGRHCGCPGKI